MIRRALRHAFTLLCALSLLLCVTACALWVVSHFRADVFRWARSHQYAVGAEWRADVSVDKLGSGGGVVQGFWDRESLTGDREAVVHLANDNFGLHRPFEWRRSQNLTPGLVADHPTWLRRRGFWIEREPVLAQWETGSDFWPRYPPKPRGTGHRIRWSVPHWFLILLTAVLPAIRLARALRRRNARRAGGSVRCGYDLRASPERCPECGAAARAAGSTNSTNPSATVSRRTPR